MEAPGYVRVVSGDINANTNRRMRRRRRRRRVHARPKCGDVAIKLIDFGSTTLEHQYHSTVVSRDTTAPEIILGTGWSYPCDMWSIGCILIELLTGERSSKRENMEHLAMMRNVLSPCADVIKRSSKEIIEKYFVPETYELRWPEKAKDLESERAVQAVQPLDILIRTRLNASGHSPTLIESIIGVRPGHAHHGKDALNHGFFRLDIKENVYRQSRRSQVTQLLLRTPRTGRLIERRLRSCETWRRRITRRDHKLPAVFEARAWINPPWQLKSFWGLDNK